jgi:cyanophycin synthetase
MNHPPIRLSESIVFMPGYPLGLGQPALRVEIVQDPPTPPGASRLAELEASFAELLDRPIEPDAARSLAGALLRWNRAVQAAAGWPAFADGYAAPSGAAGRHTLLVPCLAGGQRQAALAFGWVIAVANLALTAAPPDPAREQLPKLLKAMRPVGPLGINTLRFLQAAHEAGIPWRRVQGNVHQFGWGSRARWMDSSFTDQTTHIGSMLARDKLNAAAVLRQAGIPVPEHLQVRSADEAVKAAGRLGYPVVVKPVDLDGGAGVAAGLGQAEAVRRAYAEARKLSPAVMVEKHFEGNDYRLQVFQGEVIWASHRIPGGVIGDGRTAVAGLLAAVNAEPLRGPAGSNALLKYLKMDAEALELLAEQDLTPESVPDQDRFVRLRRAANVASGGRAIPALEQAHPDNLALAVRAAQALRLDLAGVDLLIPDLRRSWLESGAAICEVNAQPQLWPTLPALILKRLVPGEGRIPVVVILGTPPRADWPHQLARRLGKAGRRVGVAGSHGATLAGAAILRGPCDLLSAGRALLMHPEVDLAMLCLEDFGAAQTGLPVDRFDLLILAGGPRGANDGQRADWLTLARGLAHLCRGPVLADAACPDWAPLPGALAGRPVQSASLKKIVELAARSLRILLPP